MDGLEAILLAIIQGLTEFLPISSSAHLILPSQLLGWPEQGLAFDVAVHIGSLIAVLFYFRTDVKQMILAWFAWVFYSKKTPEGRLAWAVIFGTIPVGIIGLIVNYFGWVETYFRDTSVIAITTLVFAFVLWWADVHSKKNRHEASLTAKDIFVIGFAQAIALIPGTSRSGITMTAALLLGLTQQAAARFSFLLSIPAILLPGALKSYELSHQVDAIHWELLLLGVVVSASAAFICIHYFLKLLDQIGFMPFIYYRIALGIFLMGLLFFR
jgi:undecaprenyl-diphosphatase